MRGVVLVAEDRTPAPGAVFLPVLNRLALLFFLGPIPGLLAATGRATPFLFVALPGLPRFPGVDVSPV